MLESSQQNIFELVAIKILYRMQLVIEHYFLIDILMDFPFQAMAKCTNLIIHPEHFKNFCVL